MKNSILLLFAIVALASCGNETKETKLDTTVVDSVLVDSTTCDSSKVCKDTTCVKTEVEKK